MTTSIRQSEKKSEEKRGIPEKGKARGRPGGRTEAKKAKCKATVLIRGKTHSRTSNEGKETMSRIKRENFGERGGMLNNSKGGGGTKYLQREHLILHDAKKHEGKPENNPENQKEASDECPIGLVK